MGKFDFDYFKNLYSRFSHHSCKELENLYITWNGVNYDVEGYNPEHDDITDIGEYLSNIDGYIEYDICYRYNENLECEIENVSDENIQKLMDDVLKKLPPTSNMNAFTVTDDNGDYGALTFIQEYKGKLDNDGIKYVIDNIEEIEKLFPDHTFDLYKLNIDEDSWGVLQNTVLDNDDFKHKAMFIYFK